MGSLMITRVRIPGGVTGGERKRGVCVYAWTVQEEEEAEKKRRGQRSRKVFQAAAAISSQGSFSHTVDTKVPLPLWNRKKAQNTARLHFTTKRKKRKRNHPMDNNRNTFECTAVSLLFSEHERMVGEEEDIGGLFSPLLCSMLPPCNLHFITVITVLWNGQGEDVTFSSSSRHSRPL